MKYPTGVENHGGKLRIWFVYKGVRVRENLGVPDTAKNRRVAGELRASVCYAIKTGVFDYAKQFPSSRNLEKFGETRQDLTIKELAEKFLALKETEVAKTSLNTYRAVIKNILSIIGEKNLASSINKEKLLEVRKERKRAARTVLTGMCYSVGSATRQGSSSPTRFIGQSAMTSRT